MALDGIFLHHIANELKNEAQFGRISQIYQPNKDEIIIAMRTIGGNKKLLLSSRANSPRVHFTDFAPENPATPPMFCMLLRKRLNGGKLMDIRQPDLERILFFDFEATNEIGDRVNITVAVEIMGKYSNVIIIDSDGIIIDALKRVDMTMSSQRIVLPNLPYELPPSQDKLSILKSSREEICQKIINTDKEMLLNKAILLTVQGISPIICREIEYSVSSSQDITNKNLNDTQFQKLNLELTNLIDITQNCSGIPVIIKREDGLPMDISFIKINQYENAVLSKQFESFSLLLDSFYSERDTAERMKAKSRDMHKLLSNLTERLSRKINIQKADLEKCSNREQLRIKGDLLQANIYAVERGAPFIDVENFYDENLSTIRIALDPAISPSANAQKYYKKYAKAKTAQQMLTLQINKAIEELDYIDAVSDSLSRSTTEKELAQIRLELVEQGYIKQAKTKQRPPSALAPIEYKSSDGFKILVGRNNKQNDQLTLKTANNNDMWFHTKDIHGSHTVVITQGKEIPDQTVIEAAQIAAYHSKGRNSSQIPVDYTQVRFVSKPSGAKPGMVIYVNNKTVYVTPKIPISDK